MKFKNPRYQKIHDEINENRKKLGLKSVDESFEEWKAAGMPKHEEDGWAKRHFKEWMEDPRRDEIERNNKMMVESLREIEANLGKNQYKEDKEDRKKKKSAKPKRKCRCKK
jgi:hypothetical protein